MSGVVAKKVCIVPGCGITTQTCPDKRFISVPKTDPRRSAWFQAIKVPEEKFSRSTVVFVCEDHFDLKEDAENYLKLTIFPYPKQKVMIKHGVVPHIFKCQTDELHVQPLKEWPVAVDRARRSLLQYLLYSPNKGTTTTTTTSSTFAQSPAKTISVGSTSTAGLITSAVLSPYKRSPLIKQNERVTKEASISPPVKDIDLIVTENRSTGLPITPQKRLAAEAICELSEKPARLDPDELRSSSPPGPSGPPGPPGPPGPTKFSDPPKTDNKAVMAKPHVRSKFVQCGPALVKQATKDVGTSPVKFSKKTVSFKLRVQDKPLNDSTTTESSSFEDTSLSSYKVETNGSSSSEGTGSEMTNQAKAMQIHRINLIKKDPLYYIGVTSAYYFIIDALASSLKTDDVCVLICLQKIRLNQTFKGLSYDFGVSESFCSKIFSKLVPSLEACLSTLILWPDKNNIMSKLPIPFRARYSHVQSIIDCFEVEIEKPFDPIKQTLSWSQYKKCNTLKFLISSTPDGYINYISGGFGGRTSDAKITESSGYLDVLPDGAGVMADRGFKGVATDLEKKKCSLVRPPSVSASEKSTKDEVKLSKRIASLRIHIERVIRRIREFSFLKPHAVVNHNLLKYVDCIVKIVCGLINLQEPIIKKLV